MTASAVCPICGEARTKPFNSIWPVALRSCQVCKARFVWPLPTDDELRRRYEREHASGKWNDLVDQGDPQEPRRRAALLTRLASTERRRLLDVGFGDGRFLAVSDEMGWSAIGLEVTEEAARPLADRYRVAVGTLDALAEREAIDCAVFWDVLEHVPHPGALLQSVASRLSVGGLVAASMPSASSVTARIEGDRWRYYDLGTYGHLVHMNPRHLRSLFEQAGLEVVYSETRGSVDLRHSLRRSSVTGARGQLLDRLSGMIARVAVPMGLGNTLLMIGRRAASSAVAKGLRA